MKGFKMLRATLHEQEIRRIVGVPAEGERVVQGISPIGLTEDYSLYFINTPLTDESRDALAARKGCIVVALSGLSLAHTLNNCLVLEAENPRAELAKVLTFVREERRVPPLLTHHTIASSAVISPMAAVEGAVEIGEDVSIEPFCFVGPDVKIGRGSIIRSGSRIHPRVTIGENSIIGSNSVIGHQGYGFVRDEAGNKFRMPHLGGVAIGSHVEIGGLVSMPSGTIMPTVIEDYAKIDELVHVAHNVRVAKGVSVIAGSVIGGHAVIEEDAWLGINSSIREGRRVGIRSLVGMDASIQQDLADNSVARAPRPDVRRRTDDDPGSIGFSKGK
jgi:UDP-3-O-[3-hydroxymyristoyl] glucosamine N-acyltransferase